jgi:hypothetical protein
MQPAALHLAAAAAATGAEAHSQQQQQYSEHSAAAAAAADAAAGFGARFDDQGMPPPPTTPQRDAVLAGLSLPGGGVRLVTCATRTRLMGCTHHSLPGGVRLVTWTHTGCHQLNRFFTARIVHSRVSD